MVTVDPAKTAVLILDLQNEVIYDKGAFGGTGAAAHARQQNVVGNAARLADAARAAGLPVIHVHHQRSVGADSGADSKQNAVLWRNSAERRQVHLIRDRRSRHVVICAHVRPVVRLP